MIWHMIRKENKSKEKHKMGIPQIIMIVMLCLVLFINIANHNKPREGKYNGWDALIGIAIQVSLLTWGGFF